VFADDFKTILVFEDDALVLLGPVRMIRQNKLACFILANIPSLFFYSKARLSNLGYVRFNQTQNIRLCAKLFHEDSGKIS
jgi:hypothetical protein